MEDVAAKAGVSRALVSLVMRESPKVSAKSKAAVLKAAEELNYRPNLLARSLASKRSMMLGVVFNDLHNQYFAEVADGIEQVASRASYRLVINSSHRSVAGERKAIETFLELLVDGVIVLGTQTPWELLADLRSRTQVPITAASRQFAPTSPGVSDAIDLAPATDPHALTLDSVTTDDEAGAQIAIDHLVDLGHRRITHVDGGDGAGACERRVGYRAAMMRHGLDEHVDVISGEFTEDAGRRAAASVLKRPTPPTAIFAANDLVAAGIITEANRLGLGIPTDLSVIGYDNTSLASLDLIRLSTINQPRRLMGQIAAELTIERLNDGRTQAEHRLLRPTLIKRSTTGPHPSVGPTTTTT